MKKIIFYKRTLSTFRKSSVIALIMGIFSLNPLFAQKFVSVSGSGSQDGTSWTNSFPASSLATAIGTGGNTVYLKAGTYTYNYSLKQY